MFRSLSRKRRFGFTLVEVLVTTVVVGVMAAVVIPAVVKQSTAGDSPRVASDLGSVKTAMEVFSQNVRPRMPGDIEDLVNAISTTEDGLDGEVYTTTNTPKWKGPYLEWTADATLAQTNTIFGSGGSALIVNSLYRCPGPTTTVYTTAAGEFAPCEASEATTNNGLTDRYASVAVKGIGFNSTEFQNINDVIDGTSETSDQDSGLLRQNQSGTVFFLAVPYTKP